MSPDRESADHWPRAISVRLGPQQKGGLEKDYPVATKETSSIQSRLIMLQQFLRRMKEKLPQQNSWTLNEDLICVF